MIHLTRHWSTSHRGWLAVHAAKSWEPEIGPALGDLLVDEFGADWADGLPTGAVLGAVELTAVLPAEEVHGDMINPSACDDLLCGDFSSGRFAWRKGAFRRLRSPVSYKGMQGFFEVPDDIMMGLEGE
jgi:hypothetical protein